MSSKNSVAGKRKNYGAEFKANVDQLAFAGQVSVYIGARVSLSSLLGVK